MRARSGTGERQLLLRMPPTTYPIAPEAGALTFPGRAASGLSLADLPALPTPQSLSRSHVASRERLTIIPHGVPYMTKLLRYFVSEDSIFLHLEHVQGEGAWRALSAPRPLGMFVVLFHSLQRPSSGERG